MAGLLYTSLMVVKRCAVIYIKRYYIVGGSKLWVIVIMSTGSDKSMSYSDYWVMLIPRKKRNYYLSGIVFCMSFGIMRVCLTALNDDCTLFNAPIIIPVFLSHTMNNVQKKDKKIEMVVTRMVVNK